MKVINVVLIMTICFLHATLKAQKQVSGDITEAPNILIDTSKPYVYLEFEHVGIRRPLRNGEPNHGIWLRIKNNCKLPIVVLVILEQPQNPDKSIVLQDEVVPNRRVIGEDARSFGVLLRPEHDGTLDSMRDIVQFPNMTEDEVRGAEAAATASKLPAQRPAGYNVFNGFNTFETKLVAPGDQLLFSVPANHVSKDWHIEIPFRLAFPNQSSIRPPYSYLSFYQEDLDRAQDAQEKASKSKDR